MMNQSWLATRVLNRINQIGNGKKKSNMMLYKFNKFFFFWDSKWRKKLENYHSKNQSDYI